MPRERPYEEGVNYVNGVAYRGRLPDEIAAKVCANISREWNLLLRMPEFRADYEAILADPSTVIKEKGA